MRDVIKLQRRTESGLEDVLSFGDIVASGSNANGEWVRWSDGTQICRSTIELTGLDVPDTHAVWGVNQYVPPAAFVGSYDVAVTYARASTFQGGQEYVVTLGAAFYGSNILTLWNTGQTSFYAHPGACIRGTDTSVDRIFNVTSATIRVVAIGKWK